MSEGQASGAGTFCWTELMTRDVDAAKAFYSDLIGWQTETQNIAGMQYTTLTPPGMQEPVGGMMQMDGPQFEGVPPHWLAYIAVKNVDDRARRCGELGGQVLCPPTDIPNIGRFCVIQDPTGATIALFQGR